MPRLNASKAKNAPEGFAKIHSSLDEFGLQLKEAEKEKGSRLSTKSNEATWKILQLNHERSRYVYDLYYKRKAISKELYDWLLKEKYADKMLIAKWKKKGYEKLCCLSCIQSTYSVHNRTCICRVPRETLEDNARKKNEKLVFEQCVHCGCSGCASVD